MNIRKYIYSGAIVFLIVAFNWSLIAAINGKHGWRISISILVLLAALIAFKNRILPMRAHRNLLLAVALVGAALTIVNLHVGFAYAIIGLLLLMLAQLKIVIGGKPGWFVVGGNPMHKLDDTERRLAGIGLAMMGSVLLTFIAEIVWMAQTVG